MVCVSTFHMNMLSSKTATITTCNVGSSTVTIRLEASVTSVTRPMDRLARVGDGVSSRGPPSLFFSASHASVQLHEYSSFSRVPFCLYDGNAHSGLAFLLESVP